MGLKEHEPDANLDRVVLIGHSNGGDIFMMFAEKYPKYVATVISLDSLRYLFPVNDRISILSLRANDTQADKGVLPKTVANLVNMKAKHINMCDLGSPEVKQKIIDLVSKFMAVKS